MFLLIFSQISRRWMGRLERLVAVRPHRRRSPGRSLFLPPTSLQSTGTSARWSTMFRTQSRSCQLYSSRRLDRMVSLVGLFADLRLGRQDATTILRQSRTGIRWTTLRRSRSWRNLLSKQSALPGQERPTHRWSMVRLGRLERVHGVMRRRFPFAVETLRQPAASTRWNRLFRLRYRVRDV
jgi:hypothetical protein